MPLVLNSRAPGGRGHRATSNELRKADSPSLPGPSDQGQSGDGASPETASWSRPPCWLGLAASRGPGRPPLSPKPRCAPLPPGAAGLPSLQARLPPASTSGSGRRPPSSPTFSVASGTSPPPPAAHSGFCHPDASQTNLSGLTSLSFLRLSGQGTASLPPGRPSRWPPCSDPVPAHLPSPRHTTASLLLPRLRRRLRLSPCPSPWGSYAAFIFLGAEGAHGCSPRHPSSDSALSCHVPTVPSEAPPASLMAPHTGPALLFEAGGTRASARRAGPRRSQPRTRRPP